MYIRDYFRDQMLRKGQPFVCCFSKDRSRRNAVFATEPKRNALTGNYNDLIFTFEARLLLLVKLRHHLLLLFQRTFIRVPIH